MERITDSRRGRSVHGLSGSNCFSVYVGNLSPKVNWRYLKKLFQRFGNVLDVFIPQKKDFSGSNFGFVRFSTIREAETVVLMFGGAWVADRRIIVNIAKFNSRTRFWRKKRNDSGAAVHFQNNKNISGDSAAIKVEKGECSQAETSEVKLGKGKEKLDKDSGETKVSTEMNKTEVGRRLRIRGHIESEDLWKLKSYLVGEMPTVCTTESVRDRLHQWGLGDIKVKRLGGKSFILWIEDNDLYKMLEDLQWSYLKEIFCSISTWSENGTQIKRATWLEIIGVPIHCWNDTTFKRLIQNWGEFEAFGENLDCSLDCEKMKILITTQQVQKVCEVVELEVGSMIYEIRVTEIGFSDPLLKCPLSENFERRSKSETSFSSEDNRSNSPIESVYRHTHSGEEELNAAIIGNRQILEKGDSDMGNGRSLGECDLVGVNIEKNVEGPTETTEKNENKNILSYSKPNTNWAELLFKNQLVRNENKSVKIDWEVGSDILVTKEPNSENINPKSPKTLGSNQNQPFSKNQDTSFTKGLENPQSVGGRVREEGQDTEKAIDWVSSAESEESFRNTERVFFPEWESKRERKKRYGSMNQLQDKVLSEKEKKKTDRAIRREKKNEKNCEFSELSGRSLSESDLVQHWEIVSKKAKKALEVGKSLGIEIDGNEEEVIKELADLDSN
ncbi:hypothetical protein GQ457_16G029250 [Hibiscus cannabinus]